MSEKRALQVVISIACLVPILAGSAGIVFGASFLGGDARDLDSHFRYLSGLLLGIGLMFLASVPRIEFHGPRFRLLTAIVVVGGFGRLFSMLDAGIPGSFMVLALGMELVVTPGLCLWHHSFCKRLTFGDI